MPTIVSKLMKGNATYWVPTLVSKLMKGNLMTMIEEMRLTVCPRSCSSSPWTRKSQLMQKRIYHWTIGTVPVPAQVPVQAQGCTNAISKSNIKDHCNTVSTRRGVSSNTSSISVSTSNNTQSDKGAFLTMNSFCCSDRVLSI